MITYQFLDNGEIQYKVKKRNPNKIANYGILPYSPTQHELFCLRLLLINFPARSFDDLLQFNGLSFSTFADAACARGLIDNEKEFFDCMDEAIQSYRPSKDLRWLFCNLIRSRADCSVLYNKYFEKLNEDIKDEYALKKELVSLLNRMKVKRQDFFNDIPLIYHNPYVIDQEIPPSLLPSQKDVLEKLLGLVESECSENLCFLQGAAGTGKTFLIKTFLNILQANGKKFLISATTGIAASQYKGATTVHSLFHLTIDKERISTFTSNIQKNTYAEKLLKQADIIIIGECSMLTKRVINDCDLTLRYAMINSNEEGIPSKTPYLIPPFGGKKILFVGDFLQLPPVDLSSSPVFQRMIFDLPWWNSVLTLSLADPIRCTEFYWFAFLRLLSLNHPFIKSMKWESIPFIKVTTSFKDAFTWYISDISINNENPYYPLDRL